MMVNITAVDGLILSMIYDLNEFVNVNQHTATASDVIIQDIDRHIIRHPFLDDIGSNNKKQTIITLLVSLWQF